MKKFAMLCAFLCTFSMTNLMASNVEESFYIQTNDHKIFDLLKFKYNFNTSLTHHGTVSFSKYIYIWT